MNKKELLEKLEELANKWRDRGFYLENLSKALGENPTLKYISSIYFSHFIDIKDLIKFLQEAEENDG